MILSDNASASTAKWAALVSFIAIALTAGCGDDGVTGAFDGDLEITPDTINFPQTVVGDTSLPETVILEAGDNGSETIRINNLALGSSDEPHLGEDGVFEILNYDELGLDSIELESNEAIELDVVYSPEGPVRYADEITFSTNIAGQSSVTIDVIAPTPAPEISAASTLRFGRVPADGPAAQRMFEITNNGTAALEIDDIIVADTENFDVSYPVLVDDLDSDERSELGDHNDDWAPAEYDRDAPQYDVEPGDSYEIRVWYDADDESVRSTQMDIVSNDPQSPNTMVALIANSDAPCLTAETVDFGPAALGQTTQRAVTLENCSDLQETVITDIELGKFYDDEFVSLEDIFASDDFDDSDMLFDIIADSLPGGIADGDNATMDAGGTAVFQMLYSPIEEQVDDAVLRVSSNDESSPLYIDVLGEGVDRECPIADARIGIEGTGIFDEEFVEAVPLDTLDLDGTNSFSPEDDGTDLSYEWSVVDRPGASLASVNNATQSTADFRADIAGTYVIELSVFDEVGIVSCEPDQVTAFVDPESDIHVELTWEVPASPTGTGADLDLHYLHPNGSWSTSPWGVFWNNREPDWEDGSEISLDIDDLTGDEPENINHDNPDPNHDYAVGVYYFGDEGFGAVDAQLRLYFLDDLVFEGHQTLENAPSDSSVDPDTDFGDFWYVLNIGVAPGGFPDVDLLDIVDELYVDSGFPDVP